MQTNIAALYLHSTHLHIFCKNSIWVHTCARSSRSGKGGAKCNKQSFLSENPSISVKFRNLIFFPVEIFVSPIVHDSLSAALGFLHKRKWLRNKL